MTDRRTDGRQHTRSVDDVRTSQNVCMLHNNMTTKAVVKMHGVNNNVTINISQSTDDTDGQTDDYDSNTALRT